MTGCYDQLLHSNPPEEKVSECSWCGSEGKHCVFPSKHSPKAKEDWEEDINTRLWYALGDVDPTEEKMIRAVNTIVDLIKIIKAETISSYAKELRERIEKETANTTDADTVAYLPRRHSKRDRAVFDAGHARAIFKVLSLLTNQQK